MLDELSQALARGSQAIRTRYDERDRVNRVGETILTKLFTPLHTDPSRIWHRDAPVRAPASDSVAAYLALAGALSAIAGRDRRLNGFSTYRYDRMLATTATGSPRIPKKTMRGACHR